jgi:hypothetical protein
MKHLKREGTLPKLTAEQMTRIDSLLSAPPPPPPDGVPCSHPGCLSHVTRPCQGCGRIGGISAQTRARASHFRLWCQLGFGYVEIICDHCGRVVFVIREGYQQIEGPQLIHKLRNHNCRQEDVEYVQQEIQKP